MGFAIDRFWSQPPGWFHRQPHGARVSLYADFVLYHESPEARKAGESEARINAIKDRINRFKSEGAQCLNSSDMEKEGHQ